MSPFHSEDKLPFWSSGSLQQLLNFLALLSFVLYAASLALKENRMTRTVVLQTLSRSSLARALPSPSWFLFSFSIFSANPHALYVELCILVLLLRSESASLHPVINIPPLTSARYYRATQTTLLLSAASVGGWRPEQNLTSRLFSASPARPQPRSSPRGTAQGGLAGYPAARPGFPAAGRGGGRQARVRGPCREALPRPPPLGVLGQLRGGRRPARAAPNSPLAVTNPPLPRLVCRRLYRQRS